MEISKGISLSLLILVLLTAVSFSLHIIDAYPSSVNYSCRLHQLLSTTENAIITNVVIKNHSIGKTAAADHTAQSTNLVQPVRASTTIPASVSVFRHMSVLVTKSSV